jgi:hypothetical protein
VENVWSNPLFFKNFSQGYLAPPFLKVEPVLEKGVERPNIILKSSGKRLVKSTIFQKLFARLFGSTFSKGGS